MDEMTSFEEEMRNPKGFMVTFCNEDKDAAEAFAKDAIACGWLKVEVRLHAHFGYLCIQGATEEDYENVFPWLAEQEVEDKRKQASELQWIPVVK